MRTFVCRACEHPVFFENVRCERCQHRLGFIPESRTLATIDPVGDPAQGIWERHGEPQLGQWRMCRNGAEHDACNWLIPVQDGHEYCLSCRLNLVIPDLGHEAERAQWIILERAKRRLLWSLMTMGIPVIDRRTDPVLGLGFRFLASQPDAPVMTGHQDGVITINIAEADDAHRESTRVRLHESYRTVLGTLRHESGHYYFAKLILGSPYEGAARDLFGDERADYDAALKRHYHDGPPADWQQRFISAYASMHPCEDWAETWAHYLHIMDSLETARSFGIEVHHRHFGEVAARPLHQTAFTSTFDAVIAGWLPLVFAINSLNRSMGIPDLYPFVLAPPAIAKLRFIHDLIGRTLAVTVQPVKVA